MTGRVSLWAPPPMGLELPCFPCMANITASATRSAAKSWRPGWGYTRRWCGFITSNFSALGYDGKGLVIEFGLISAINTAAVLLLHSSNCARSKWFKFVFLSWHWNESSPLFSFFQPNMNWVQNWKMQKQWPFKVIHRLLENCSVLDLLLIYKLFLFLLLLHSLVPLPSTSFVILLPLSA